MRRLNVTIIKKLCYISKNKFYDVDGRNNDSNDDRNYEKLEKFIMMLH